MTKASSTFIHHTISPSLPRSHVITCSLLIIIIITAGVGGLEDNECDFILSDSPKEGKVVHTFHTSCQEGEVVWRYPYSGLELTFNRPLPPSYISAIRSPIDDGEDDDEGELQFCYVVSMTNVNVTMMREMPGPRFRPSERESCLASRTSTFNHIKFYIESTQSLKSSLIGKFQLLYMWSKPTPFERCRGCTTRELSTAVCTAGNVFTGHVERSGKNRSTLAVSVSKIFRFDETNVPRKFCLQRRKGFTTVTSPNLSNRDRQEATHASFFQRHKCDRIVVPFNGRCPYRRCPHGECTLRDFLQGRSPYEELIFVADAALSRFKPRCVMPAVEFWKVWRSMEANDETDCLLIDYDYHKL